MENLKQTPWLAAKRNLSAGTDIKIDISLLLSLAGERIGETGGEARWHCDSQSQSAESSSRGGDETQPTEATMPWGSCKKTEVGWFIFLVRKLWII